MRSDKEDNAQQSKEDKPATRKRSPLKEIPSSLQRLRQAIAEEVGERRISAAVGRLRNMQVCDHGPTPHVASERRERQVQKFEGFCADKGAQAQCCQYDCARHEECHGALAMIHGGVLGCLVPKNILVQQTTTPKQPPLKRSLKDLIHKQARRATGSPPSTTWRRKRFNARWSKHKRKPHCINDGNPRGRWDSMGSMRRRRMNKKRRTRVQVLQTYSTRVHKSRKRRTSVRELKTRRTEVHQSKERQARVPTPRTCHNSTRSTQCADAIITPRG